jgi:rod shape-determining protein MreD
MIPFAFLLSLIALFLKISVYPGLELAPFMPLLAVLSLLKPMAKAIPLATLAGFIIDLLSSDPLGIHALNYTLCVLIAYRCRSLFSAESPIQLGLYTALYSFVSTQLQIALLFLFDRRVEFLGKWWLVQWMSLPLIDAVYAMIWFAGPLSLFRFTHRTWTVYWLKKNDQNFRI